MYVVQPLEGHCSDNNFGVAVSSTISHYELYGSYMTFNRWVFKQILYSNTP